MASSNSIKVPLSGRALLTSPLYNKGTAFTEAERHEFNLIGLLPTNVQTLTEQLDRAYEQFSSCSDDIAKNVFMNSMLDQNIVLYFALLMEHLEEMFPIVYTPTEGAAIQNYSRIFRRPNGCFLDIDEDDNMKDKLLNAADGRDIKYLVVTDGEAILGLGDQGIGGVLISVAKLVLTTACGGVDPACTLPVVLDVGTENHELLNSPLYLGKRHPRVRGSDYYDFVEKFVKAATEAFPGVYIHFEDFGVTNARKLLDTHRDKIPCFNDDIQGTGCVVFAGITTGLKISEIPLKEARVLVYGSGSAGCGIAQQIANGIAVEYGIDAAEANKQITCVDKGGVLTESDDLSPAQKPFARPSEEWSRTNKSDLRSIVSSVEPHVLIGTSTKPGSFNEDVVREMAKHVDRPIILPLSNPTSLHEAKPEDLIKWTEGKALVATGSPFPTVHYNGKDFEIGECNNSCCFPGIGLGCMLGQVEKLTDEMLLAAVKAMASSAPALQDASKPLVPGVTRARDVSVDIATAIIKEGKKLELCREASIPKKEDQIPSWVEEKMWKPVYPEYQRAK